MRMVDLAGKPLTAEEVDQAEGVLIEQPLVIIFEFDDGVTFNIHPQQGYDYKGYGLLACDLVRHIANAFGVDEDDVWEWVDRERQDPTAKVTQLS